jgi:hypothetical protein
MRKNNEEKEGKLQGSCCKISLSPGSLTLHSSKLIRGKNPEFFAKKNKSLTLIE